MQDCFNSISNAAKLVEDENIRNTITAEVDKGLELLI
jgi:hypothetical protein